MFNFMSIRYRIMGLSFLLISLTVTIFIYLANRQMEELFCKYLMIDSYNMKDVSQIDFTQMGTPEMTFLHSVHQSLIWVGLVFVIIGLIASYFIAVNITVPLRRLSAAAEHIRNGKSEQNVPITTNDEVGQLAEIFNQMSTKLAENEKLRREFLANIAHELRTPLAVLNGNLELMLDGVSQPSMEKLFSMQEEVMRLTRLVNDLRDLSLAEVHQLELHKQKTDINTLLKRAGDMLKPLLEEKNLYFDYKLSDNLPKIDIDVDRMNQVFYNILINAVRYANKSTSIIIKTDLNKIKLKDFIQITIQNHGINIAREDLPHIFDHFYRGDKSRGRKNGASGIGLSLAKQFVENHNGLIKAENIDVDTVAIIINLPKSS